MRSWRVSWRNLTRKKWRTFLTIAAIVIGVASTAAAVGTVQTTQKMISDLTEKQLGNVDYYVFSSDNVLKADWIEKTAEVDGVAQTLGTFQSSFFVKSVDGVSAVDISQRDRWQRKANIIGVSDMESDILDLEVVEGSFADDGIAIDEHTAAIWGVRVGDVVTFEGQPIRGNLSRQDEARSSSGRETYEAKISAIFQDTFQFVNPDSWSAASGQSWQILLPLHELQTWIGLGNVIQEVQVKVQDDFNEAFVREKLDEALSDEESLFVQPAIADENRVATGFEELYAILYVVGGLSLLISVFILYNTLYISIVERQREFAIMKTVGYTSWQVQGQIFREVALFALVGTVFGIGLGMLLTIGLVDLLFQTFQNKLTYDIQWREALLVSFVAGITIPLLAAWLPVFKAGRVSVTSVIRNGSQTLNRSKGYIRAVVAIVLILPGLFVNHMIAFLPLFLGVAFLFPYIFRGIKWVLSPLNTWLFGREGKVAARTITRNINRTSMTAAILSFGVTLFVFIGSLGVAFADATESLTRQTLGGDIRIQYSVPITTAQENKWQNIEGVEEVVSFPSGMFIWHMDGESRYLQLSGVTPAQMEKFPFFTYDQKDQGDLMDQLREPHTVVLSTAAYEQWGRKVGDTIVLDTMKGEQQFEVVGVVDTMQPGAGYFAFAHVDTLARDLGVSERREAILQVQDEQIGAVKNTLLENDSLNIAGMLTIPEVIQSRTEQTADIFRMLNGIVGLGIVVAGIGMMNTLLMNTMERIREIGVMRAVGVTRRQMQKMILSEAFFIGTSAACVGAVMGIVVMYMTTVQSSDYWMPLPFMISWNTIAFAVIFSLVVSLLASLLPGRKADQVNISNALQHE